MKEDVQKTIMHNPMRSCESKVPKDNVKGSGDNVDVDTKDEETLDNEESQGEMEIISQT